MNAPTPINEDNFITIQNKLVTYRFFGMGVWRVAAEKGWLPINGIHVPAEVLRIAAESCVVVQS